MTPPEIETEEQEEQTEEVDDLETEGGGEEEADASAGMEGAERLPEALRGKSPQELGTIFTTMMQTLQYQGEELKRMRDLGAPAHARDVEPEAQKPMSEEERKEWEEELRDKILDNPVETVLEILENSQYAQRFARLEDKTSEQSFLVVRQKLPDFDKYEDRVRQRLRESGIPLSQVQPQLLEYTYYAEKGIDAVEGEQNRRNSQPTSQKPTPQRNKPSGKEFEFENETEKAIFEASGLSKEDFFDLKRNEEMVLDETYPNR